MSKHQPATPMQWGAMAVGNEQASAVIYHWQATRMSSDGGIGDYVQLRDYQNLLDINKRLVEALREIADGCRNLPHTHVDNHTNRTKEQIDNIARALLRELGEL